MAFKASRSSWNPLHHCLQSLCYSTHSSVHSSEIVSVIQTSLTWPTCYTEALRVSYAYFHSSAYKPAQDYLQNDVFTVSEPHEGRDSSYYLAMRSTQQGLRYSRYSINACGRNRSLTISFPSMPHWPLPLSSSSTHPIQVNGIYQLAFKKLFYKYIKCIVIGLTELHKIMSLSIFFGGGIFPHLRFHNLLGVA